MMKKIIICSLLFIGVLQITSAQELDIFKPEAKPLAEKMNPKVRTYPKTRREDVTWYKVIYRIVDLKEKINQKMYFPTDPVGDRANLFTTIFNAVTSGKVKSYTFDLADEKFTPENQVNLETDILKKYTMTYKANRDSLTNEPKGFTVDPYSSPSAEVKKYYIKEIWYFDKHTSIFRNQILAICPVWERVDADGVPQKIPLFWVQYRDIEPYLAGQSVLATNKNMQASLTYDGMFKKRLFQGNIYKESNIDNRGLIEYCINRDEAKVEQDRIETSLINYESDLWEY